MVKNRAEYFKTTTYRLMAEGQLTMAYKTDTVRLSLLSPYLTETGFVVLAVQIQFRWLPSDQDLHCLALSL